MPSPQSSYNEHRTRLIEVCRDLLGEQRLVVASNRGPVEYEITDEGRIAARRGRGGLVTSLSAVSQFCKITWVASAMGEADRRAAQGSEEGILTSPLPGQNIDVRFVVCPRNTYHKYYNVISNPLLWFLQHHMWNSPYTPNIDAGTYDAWQNGYVAVNRAFAQTIVEEMGRTGSSRILMLHDYQLYLVGGMVRESVADAITYHLVHVPWPSPSYWRLLPPTMRQGICAGLCANDVVGFQTVRSANSFLHTAKSFLQDAEIDHQSRTVRCHGHLTRVSVHPIAVDCAGLRRTAGSVRVREYQERIRQLCGECQIIARVDRIDPSRNILRGFRAFDIMLERHRELVGQVKFLAFLTPSRTRVREYQRYADEMVALTNAINDKYGRQGWRPIELFMENNYLQAIAGLRLYDVMLANAVVDGMNLVAKEGPIVNTRDGVLVLSEGTGAYEQLQEGVLAVTPTDLEGTAQALHEALAMSPEEKARRAELLQDIVEREDVTAWLHRQFTDLQSVVRAEQRPAGVGEPQPLTRRTE